MRKITIARTAIICLVAVINLTFASQLSAQCNFNCIDTINVSVNNICTATITPEMVLKGFDPMASCNYGIQLFNPDGSIINLDITRADIGPQYVGSVLKVRVFDAGNFPSNSCWGYINVEDKLPPDIKCVGNDTLECHITDIFADESVAKTHLENQIESTLVDNCGNEEVTVNITRNDLVRMLCLGEFSAMRIVGYNVLDNNNNVTTCEDTIYYRRFPLDSLDAPKNYTGNMAIQCTEPYPTIDYLIGKDSESPGNNSTPNINGISIADHIDSLFVERGLCNFKMTTIDLIFETCGNTYKIVRNWHIVDWCSSNSPKVFNQVIKVLDDNISLNNISNLGPFPADDGKCDVSVELPFPVVSQNECNSWTYTISVREPDGVLFFPYGGVRDSMPQTVTRRFPIGISRVRYTVEDACGNMDSKEFNVTVEDQEPPIPVCDFRTVVTLNDSFLGKVLAKSFDDGSYDHCSGIVSYKVRRVDRFETSCETPADFDDFVKFCCSDIGNAVMIELQVTDGAGLTSTCMAEARIQFKGAGPSVTCAPGLPVQSCTTYETFDINGLTPPVISSSNPCIADALTPVIRETGRSIDICGDGYIDVEWYYNITGEEEVICTYRILFTNLNPFTANEINWPANRTVDSCDDAPPTIDELTNIIGSDIPCSNVFASEPVDRIFDNVPNTCLRILRTWTVVDWCRYPGDPNARWTYEQTINIVNSTGPIIDISGSNIFSDSNPDICGARIIIQGIATDDCTPVVELDWTHRLDLLTDNQESPVIVEQSGRIFEGIIDAGSYIITWTATDGCGNTTLSRQNFTIDDEYLPEAICNIVIRDMDTSNNVVVSALDFNGGSTDNCGDELSFAIRKQGNVSPPTSELVLTCADLGVNNIELWVTDKMGNQSMCLASVDIRDGLGACGFGASVITLEGNITTSENIAVESAQVFLSMNNTMVQSEMTKVDGQFQFNNLEEQQEYSLSAEKNTDYINGISTLDIILMQRHILGLQTLDSPYKIIAADINNNESISAVDMVLLRRLILGHITEFPENDSWRFIDKSYQFTDPLHPWPVLDAVELGKLEHSMEQELLAIKIGDLNATAVANSGFASARSTQNYTLANRVTRDQGMIHYEVIATADIRTNGYQIGFDFDKTAMRFVNIRSDKMDFVDEMILSRDGQMRISMSRARPLLYQTGETIFRLSFLPLGAAGNPGENIRLHNSDQFRSEVYSDRLEVMQLEMARNAVSDEIILYQNRPNPFNQLTFIDFEIPKEEEVTFDLFDINGSRVYSLKENYDAGRHQIKINRESVGLNKGIYYYQIHTHQRSLIKKMIIL